MKNINQIEFVSAIIANYDRDGFCFAFSEDDARLLTDHLANTRGDVVTFERSSASTVDNAIYKIEKISK